MVYAVCQQILRTWDVPSADLGKVAALEERGDPDQTDIVIPHHGVLFVVIRLFEDILKDWIARLSSVYH